jgi:hypothetical protein
VVSLGIVTVSVRGFIFQNCIKCDKILRFSLTSKDPLYNGIVIATFLKWFFGAWSLLVFEASCYKVALSSTMFKVSLT